MKTNSSKHRFARCAAAAVVMACGFPAWAEGVAVVVGSKSPATPLTPEQASQLFLGKTATLPGGGRAMLIDQSEGAKARDNFHAKVTGRSPAQVKAVWSKLVFSGAAQQPRAVANDAEVKKAVAENPDAVGYIDAASIDSSVKVLVKVD